MKRIITTIATIPLIFAVYTTGYANGQVAPYMTQNTFLNLVMTDRTIKPIDQPKFSRPKNGPRIKE